MRKREDQRYGFARIKKDVFLCSYEVWCFVRVCSSECDPVMEALRCGQESRGIIHASDHTSLVGSMKDITWYLK